MFKDKEKHKEYQKQYRELNWKRLLKTKYNLSEQEYTDLLESQHGVCAICGEVDDWRKLSVDHDHACCTGPKSCGSCVRGLLCSRCNTGIGQFRDDVFLLEKAVNYLRTA